MTTADVLRAARDLIADPARWSSASQHSQNVDGYGSKQRGTVCMVGAVAQVTTGNPGASLREIDQPALTALANAVRGKDSFDVEAYNDHPRRTHRAVLAAFDRAIAQVSA